MRRLALCLCVALVLFIGHSGYADMTQDEFLAKTLTINGTPDKTMTVAEFTKSLIGFVWWEEDINDNGYIFKQIITDQVASTMHMQSILFVVTQSGDVVVRRVIQDGNELSQSDRIAWIEQTAQRSAHQ